jgi:serine/threonine-protein kinase
MEAVPNINVGDVVDGKYVLERQLGQGGMGTVYAARHNQSGARVAIKIMLDVGEANDELKKRFMNEAELAKRIDSPHVAKAHDSGFWNGLPYIAMEFMEGEDLEQYLERKKKLPVAEAVDILVEISDALAAAHEQGIIHRDMKPANIFLAKKPDGGVTAKLLDFGISKAPPALGSPSLTKTSSVMGSPLYMSPEQLKSSKGVDPTTDIWAVGVIMFEAITGQPPFAGESFGQIFMSIVSAEIPPLRQKEPATPVQIEAAVAKCLVRDRTKRTQTIAELATAIAPWGTTRSVTVAERMRDRLPPSSDPTLAVAPTADMFGAPGKGSGPVPAANIAAPAGNQTSPKASTTAMPERHAADDEGGTLVMPQHAGSVPRQNILPAAGSPPPASSRNPMAAAQAAPVSNRNPLAQSMGAPGGPSPGAMRPQAPSFPQNSLGQSGNVPAYTPSPAQAAPNQPVHPHTNQPLPPMRAPQPSFSSQPNMNVATSQPNINVSSQPNINLSSQPRVPGSGPQMAGASGGWTAAKPAQSGMAAYIPWIVVGAVVFVLLAVGGVAALLLRSPTPKKRP